jgi:PIN domain nuclease of toxin-antitoxin system
VERKYLLDASALLAVIRNEPGADRVLAVLDNSVIHAVNLAEVVRKLVAFGKPVDEVIAYTDALNLEVLEELNVKQVHEVAKLAPEAKRLGLSLGDCVCLVIAEWLGMTAVTTERRWSEIRGRKVTILQIR